MLLAVSDGKCMLLVCRHSRHYLYWHPLSTFSFSLRRSDSRHSYTAPSAPADTTRLSLLAQHIARIYDAQTIHWSIHSASSLGRNPDSTAGHGLDQAFPTKDMMSQSCMGVYTLAHLAVVPPQVAHTLACVGVVDGQRDAVDRGKVLPTVAEAHVSAALDGDLCKRDQPTSTGCRTPW